MHPPTALDAPTVYTQVRFLPEECRPAYVVRHLGVTLLAVDPRSASRELVAWSGEHLTLAERNAYRAAYGEPPVGEQMTSRWSTDLPVLTIIPEALKLPRDPLWLSAAS
jgi:hypothetical protein